MSLLLCIESSSEFGMIGLVRDGKTQVEEQIPIRDHLADAIADLFAKNKIEPKEITGIAIGIGPGSFTGLRVGLAWAKGFARGVEIPIWPVNSLKIFAATHKNQNKNIAVISSARKGEAHFAVFDPELRFIHNQSVIPYTELPNLLSANTILIGPAIEKLNEELKTNLVSFTPSEFSDHQAHAQQLAELAMTEWKDKNPPDRSSMVPDYGLDFPAKPAV